MPRFNDRILDWIDSQNDPWKLTKKVFWFAVALIAIVCAIAFLR